MSHDAPHHTENLISQLNREEPEVELIPLSHFQTKPIEWLWPNILAAGKFTLLAGEPGTGKTTLALEIASILSKGGEWPGGGNSPVCRTAIWSSEDDTADTLKPRTLAAGGDETMIMMIGKARDYSGAYRPFNPQTDIVKLRSVLKENKDIKLVIIDPVVGTVKGDANCNSDVRQGLEPIAALANETGVAILGITHLNKNAEVTRLALRVLGSTAWTAVARTVLVTARNPNVTDNGPMYLLGVAKTNISRSNWGYGYSIEEVDLLDINAPGIVWGSEVDDIEGALRSGGAVSGGPQAMESAKVFLRHMLSEGAKPSTQVLEGAVAAGIAEKTLRRAQAELGIKPFKQGKHWMWELPGDEFILANTAQVGQPDGATNLPVDDHLASDTDSKAKIVSDDEDCHTQGLTTFSWTDHLRPAEDEVLDPWDAPSPQEIAWSVDPWDEAD